VLMVAVMVMFNWIHPSEVTEAWHKRHIDSAADELQQVRDGYMGRDTEGFGSEQRLYGGKNDGDVGNAYV
jgi:hypothetical protein